MDMKRISLLAALWMALLPASALNASSLAPQDEGTALPLTQYVNPFLGTATLWDYEDLHFNPTRRAWGAEVFPGASLPFAMVQATPITLLHSGSGYQYEDSTICGFGHTCKGHWNLLHVPLMPATGRYRADDYASPFSHDAEEAHPGYYRVFLERYAINAEVTTTLRCAYYRFSYRPSDVKELIADMAHSNSNVSEWALQQEGARTFSGCQNGEGRIFFWAETNYDIDYIRQRQARDGSISVIRFRDSRSAEPLELRIGFSFTSVEGARRNFDAELTGKDFARVCAEADSIWQQQLSKIIVEGGSERHTRLFYSTLYRSCLWPCLRSDVNGDYADVRGRIVNEGFHYYTLPSFWDDYRNKLILLGLLNPDVATDVMKSIIDMGEKQGGYMPTFFHGDHASTFVAGTWQRGIHDFDLQRAYRLILKNATVPGRGGRRYLDEYIRQGWIAEKDTTNVPTEDEYKGAVTKTLEYAYDDYAVAQVARILGDKPSYRLLMKRAGNYRNVFDSSTGFFRGRIADGSFIRDFRPYYPYYQYQYREANAWQSLFYAPHDPKGIIALYPSKAAVKAKLDSLFTEPWRGYEAMNITGFIGNYCHGNQPDHSIPYMYTFIGQQEMTQLIVDSLLNHYYDMGAEHLAYAGMDDAGEMSSWFVFNAMGFYTYSPADPEYLVTVPLFPKVSFRQANGNVFTVVRKGSGRKISRILVNGKPLRGWFFPDTVLKQGGTLTVETIPSKATLSP